MFWFRDRRIKKRTFVVLVLCLAALLIPAIAVMFLARGQVRSGGVADFRIGDVSSRQVVIGSGLNLEQAYDGNLIINNSFEPLVYRQSLVIDSGDRRMMKIAMPNDPASGSYGDNFFLGAKATVMATNAQGTYQKKEGTIRSYRSDQIDTFHALNLPADSPSNLTWTCFAEQGQLLLAGGTQGYILSVKSYSETSLAQLPSKETTVGLCLIDDGFLALDQKGNLFHSQTGSEWRLLKGSVQPQLRWTSLASRQTAPNEWRILAVAESGYVLYGQRDDLREKRIPNGEDLRQVTASPAGFFLVGKNDTALFTVAGEQFRVLALPIRESDWNTVSSRGNQVLICGDRGEIVFSEDGFDFADCSSEDIRKISLRYAEVIDHKDTGNQEHVTYLNPAFASCSILSNKQILLVDKRGLIYYSDDLGKSWKSFGNPARERALAIQRMPSGQLISAGHAGGLNYALMGLRIELDGALENSVYQSGDIIQIEQIKAQTEQSHLHQNETSLQTEAAITGEWYTNQPGAVGIDLKQVAPNSGTGSLIIDFARRDKETAVLSGIYTGQILHSDLKASAIQNFDTIRVAQKMTPAAIERIKQSTAFRCEFYARNDSAQSSDISLSFSGLSLQLEPLEKKIIGDWTKYHGIVIIPTDVILPDQDIWLQLDCRGSGKLSIDRLWFGPADDVGKDVTVDLPADPTPVSLLRLGFAPVGHPQKASEYWLSESSTSVLFPASDGSLQTQTQIGLNRALLLARSVQANPWLVIEPQASESELRHLMQYLFGNQATPLGELRVSQGAVSRYSDFFDQIYIEFADTTGMLSNDWSKRSFVNWAIQIISQTPEYKQIRNQLVFLDAMAYKEDLILSEADYHTSDLKLNGKFSGVNNLHDEMERFRETVPRDPGRGLSMRMELLRDFDVSAPTVRLADAVGAMLELVGSDSNATLFRLPELKDWSAQIYLPFLTQLDQTINGFNRLTVTPVEERDDLAVFAFSQREKRCYLMVNLSERAQTCQLSELSLEGFEQTVYDQSGSRLESTRIKRRSPVFSILPGGVTIVYGEENEAP